MTLTEELTKLLPVLRPMNPRVWKSIRNEALQMADDYEGIIEGLEAQIEAGEAVRQMLHKKCADLEAIVGSCKREPKT